MYCPKCGEEYEGMVCPYCGFEYGSNGVGTEPQQDKNISDLAMNAMIISIIGIATLLFPFSIIGMKRAKPLRDKDTKAKVAYYLGLGGMICGIITWSVILIELIIIIIILALGGSFALFPWMMFPR